MIALLLLKHTITCNEILFVHCVLYKEAPTSQIFRFCHASCSNVYNANANSRSLYLKVHSAQGIKSVFAGLVVKIVSPLICVCLFVFDSHWLLHL